MQGEHLIERQILDLRIAPSARSQEVQAAARHAFSVAGIGALQQAFDAVVGNDEVLRLDRLEVDLGVVMIEDIEEVFGVVLNEAVRTQIQDLVRETSRHGMGEGVGRQVPGALRQRSHDLDDVDQPVAVLGSDDELVDFLLYFLRSGSAPWWMPRTVLEPQRLAAQVSHLIPRIYRTSGGFRRRLFEIFQNDPAATVARLTGETWLQPLAELLSRLGREAAQEQHGQDDAGPNTGSVMNAIAGGVRAGAVLAVEPADLSGPGDAAARDIRSGSRPAAEGTALRDPDPSTPAALDRGAIAGPLDVPRDQGTAGRNDGTPEAEAMFTHSAGIVLLHPFLEMLFAELGYVREGGFVDEDRHWRAVRLLAYLGRGDAAVPEFALGFEKTLCGLPQTAPLPPVRLQDREITEADTVLDSMIRHWSILKTTSRDGLREGFLQREGKLVPEADRDRLVVERRGHDVLLAHLPWPYNLFRFPWMRRPLAVDW